MREASLPASQGLQRQVRGQLAELVSGRRSLSTPQGSEIYCHRVRSEQESFDLLLYETYPWETLHEEHKRLAIEILGRLIAHALRNQNEEKNHE